MATTAVSDSTTADISGSYNGWIQGAELNVLPTSLPAGLSFDVSSVQADSGNGCAVVEWSRLSAAPVNGYNVYRISGSTRTLLTAKPFEGNFYPITGLTNGTTNTYQVAAVDILGQEHALSVPVSATPSSATETLNWINAPSAVTDNFDITVSLSSGEYVFGSFYYIDGVQTGGGYGFNSLINGVQTNIASAQFDSTRLSNGPHMVQFIGFVDPGQTIACITPPITIQVNNTISSFHLDGSGFAPQRGELCYVSATAPAGSTWTVQVTGQDSTTVIRTWQGASSLVKLAWDGKDASGNPVAISDYSIHLTVQPPGTSPPAIASPSAKNAQPAPNAAPASTKKRPIQMQAGQPDALAFVSIGASYYVDSNNHSIATPNADIQLAQVLTNAFTTLYGAGNFHIYKSDTFDPDLVVGKDAHRHNITALQQLEGWLGTAQVFYLFGHGAGPVGTISPSISARSTAFGSIDSTGIHMEFFPSTNVIFDKHNDLYIFVPTYVQSNNYVFAWIDACNSAGGNAATGERGTVDTIWATAFNATTFIGNNGFGIVNNSGATGLSPWYNWRSKFWGKMAIGQTVEQAYLNCWSPSGAVDTGTYYAYYASYLTSPPTTYSCTPGDGYGSNPRVVLYGDPFGTSLGL